MVRLHLSLILLLTTGFAMAQWKSVALNYKYTKHPDFFIPLSIHFSDSSNGFILNSNGLLQLNNDSWQPVNTGDPLQFTYTNVFTVNPRNTFLCGYDGKVSKFNGDTLRVLFGVDSLLVVNPALNTIFMIDSTHGWAAGENGTMVKIEDETYTIENLPPMYSFRDIYFDSPGHGWMIGYIQEHPEDGGIIFEYIDASWNIYSTIPGQLYDIEFSPIGIGFITGEHDIYRFNPVDNEWQPENISNYYQQYHLSLFDDNYGISVSDNSQNLIYENGLWSPGPAAAVTDMVNIKTTGYGKAWAISQIGNNNPQDFNDGKIQSLQNNVWSGFSTRYLDTVKTLPFDVPVTSIKGIDKKNLWFDGQYLHLPADEDWPADTPMLKSDTFCSAIKMFSTNFGLGLSGDLQEWTGQHWINKNIDPFLNPDTGISNVCMHVFDDTTGFICRQLFAWSSGEIQNVISYYDYKTNSLTTSAVLGTRYPDAIHFSDKSNGWCAGDSGLTVRYENDHWETFPAVTDKRLTAVFTVDEHTAWAVGDAGILLKFDETGWVQQSLPTEQDLHNVYFTDNKNGWVVGDSGLIFRYNGTEWIKDTTGITNKLYSIFMVDSTYGFVGGENGMVLQYAKRLPPPPPAKKICENGDAYFVYHPEGTGYAYQWQADSGNGFENITNDNVFSGTNSDTLWLTAMPSGIYGFKFRCIASFEGIDSISNIEELKFINRWTGEVSSAWEDPGNWSCGSLPGENTDVIINNGEIILSTTTSIRSLSVLPGVNITVAEGGWLTILK